MYSCSLGRTGPPGGTIVLDTFTEPALALSPRACP